METVIVKSDSFFKDHVPFMINKYTYDDYEAIKLHCHEFIEIAYVCNGKGLHLMRGKKHEVSKGDLFIINVDTPHSFYPVDRKNSGRLVVFNCMFMPQFIGHSNIQMDILNEIINIFLYKSVYTEEIEYSPDLKLSDNSIDDINSIYEKMYMEYTHKPEGYLDILRVLLCELLIKIYRIYKINNGSGDMKRDSFYKQQLIFDSINYLKENCSTKLNLDEISQHSFLSKSYYSAQFKKVTGLSVFEYLQKLRMEKACRLLLESGEKIASIAVSIGYSDYRFFNRTFKKIMGVTAQEYRRMRGVQR